jgi:acetyl-CoA acetyltransferase
VTLEPAPETGAIISGIGKSQIGRRLGIAGLDLTLAAGVEAIADAGITPSDIDGISTMGDTPIQDVVQGLGLGEVPYRGGGFDTGGLLSPVMSAFLAVATGQARHVLVYRTVAMMGGTVVPASDAPEPSPAALEATVRVMGDLGALLAVHAYSAANWLAMHCQRHMYLYGTTREQLGSLAVSSRGKAALNPDAAYRDPITLDDYLAARPVSTPFGLLDCDVPVDGSIAVVVSAADHAAGCPNPPVRVAAMGGSARGGGWIGRDDYPQMAATDAAAELWSRTHLRPGDIDIAELYDGFTFLTLAWLEALGLCPTGASGPFVEGGQRIALDGELPLNTYGGQLSAGRMHGYWVLHEACLQLRGGAGERQVPRRPEVAVVSAGGGPIAGCMLLTS